MNIASHRAQKGICLSLKGEITINETAMLKEVLLKALTEEETVAINLEDVTRIDTSGLQLLYAAHQTAVGKGRAFSLEKPSQSFIETARLAGLFFQSQDGYLEGCLWKGGVKECLKQL